MKFYASFIILVVVIVFQTRHVLSKKTPPLIEDRPHRKSHSTSECVFGKQHKEFGSTWFADLGPPFDVMYCIKCECIKVNKENRIYGHVRCRNIAKDCQELTCEDQIQVVGRCCKVCRNDTELTEIMQDASSILATEEEEKSNKHYAALLTNTFYTMHKNDSANVSALNSLGQTATGRFTLHKRNLYYSFYTSSYPLPTRPKLVQFLDGNGNIIEEQQVLPSGSVYQNLTGKICGIWRRMPSEYRTALKEEKLSVILAWEEYDLKIRGSLIKYRPLTTEIFSSLMVSVEDTLNTDSAGTAIVSISNVTPSVHVMVVFTGLLSSKRKSDDTVQLKLFSENRQMIIAEETIVVEKPSAELNVVEYSTAVTAADLVALTQQRVTVTLSSSKYKEPKIFGKIAPRVQCELFQAVLSSSHSNQGNKYSQKPSKASGVSWMFIDKNGALQHHVILDNVAEVSVELVTARHLTAVEDLSLSSWSNGSSKYLNPKSLEQLYNDELAVNIVKASGNNPSLIRGRLTSRPVTDSRDSPNPFLLKRTDTSVPADMIGLVWARVDSECNLNYDVSLVGKDVENQQYELYLEDIPFLAPGAPVTRRLLEELKGPNVEGYVTGLSQTELLRLETGVVYLDVWDVKYGQSVLRTKWEKVSIPESCLPNTTDNSTADNNIPSYRLFNDESEQPETTAKCFHGSQFYEHGTQWTSTLEECTMCNCIQGVTKCDVIVCPALNCSQKYTVPGSCCPSCYNATQVTNSTSNACSLGGQFFAPGSAWYPYIPPNGFDTCTVCHCDASTLRVKCGHVDCPPLNCDEKLAFRPEKKSCCKICPNRTKIFSYDVAVSDQQDAGKTERDILLAGGCKHAYGGPYENGKEWHPQIYFHGVERCVLCRCKDGVVRCDRKKCTKRSCEDQCCMNKTRCVKIRKNYEEFRKDKTPYH